MEKILYVTDLDGTLLNQKDRINKKSLEIINGLVEEGMLFTYATARSLVSASVVTEGLTTKIPVIAYNGAFIFQPETRRSCPGRFQPGGEGVCDRGDPCKWGLASGLRFCGRCGESVVAVRAGK